MHDAVTAPAKILLTEEEAAHALGFTARFLQNRRHRGDGPKYVRISARAIRYRPSDLADFAANLIRTSTSEPGPRAGQ